jgi:hypothetical protein
MKFKIYLSNFMHTRNFVVASIVAALTLVGAGCQKAPPVREPVVNPPVVNEPATPTTTPQIIGGQRDAHGCLGPAGYSWCESKNKCLRIWEESCISPAFASTTLTVLTSSNDPNTFCNGADMDSEGFRKTLTAKKIVTLPSTDRTDGERIKSILDAASNNRCQNTTDMIANDGFTMSSGTFAIKPIEGWAGVSIELCACKPLIEENLLLLPGIKTVVWK